MINTTGIRVAANRLGYFKERHVLDYTMTITDRGISIWIIVGTFEDRKTATRDVQWVHAMRCSYDPLERAIDEIFKELGI